MSLFEFIMVLQSIVIGLGLARILAGLANALQSNAIDRKAWLHLLLTAMVFVTLVQVWFEAWFLRNATSWHFIHLMLLLMNPTMLYILAHLLFPLDTDTKLSVHYFKNKHLLYSLVFAASLTGLLFHPIAFGTPFFSSYHLSSLLIGSGALVLAFTNRVWVHGLFLCMGAALVIFDIAVGGAQVS